MSRHEFREGVDGPRPLGALIMVATACVTLDITGQMQPWALAVQAAALGAAWLLRERPAPWQQSPLVLNAGLALSVAIASLLWLRGTVAIVALAHFATLTQALQILDARPRRSEFLLVALALFQVILAANLTDSVWFPVLLISFLLSTVWTLLVHTLRAEAIEARDPLAASQVTTPGLLRTTLVASVLSVLLALALFVVLPRMQAAMLPGAGFGSTLATAGFSDQVELGDLGRIRQDPTVVLRVETLEGDPPGPDERYWRGLAFDTFDGRRWSVTPDQRVPVPGRAEWGLGVGRGGGPPPDLVQRIVREPVASGVLFAHGRPRRLQGVLHRVEQDVNGGLYVPSQADERVGYTVASRRRRPDADALASDRTVAPRGDRQRFVQLPDLSPAVAALAERVTESARSDAERAFALEQYLIAHGRYTDTPPSLDPEDPRSPVEVFLEGGLAGHCEYFATAMVVLGRSLGMPMRVVNGFAGGRTNRFGGFDALARSDAHSWVEVYFEEAGWVRYDPTPADLRTAGALALGWRDRAFELASAVELWWFQQVVEYDRSDQARALRRAWLAWRDWQSGAAPEPAAAPERRPARFVDPRAIAAAAGLLAAAVLAARLRGRRRVRAAGPPVFYTRALRLLARRGVVRAASVPPRAFARQVAMEAPAAAAPFRRLTELYLAHRFGGRADRGGAEALRALRDSLRA